MPRHFTLQQAEKLLPELRVLMQQAVVLKAEFQQAETKLRAASQRISMLGGSQVDRGLLVGEKARRDTAAARLKETVDHIHERGCQVKDLDMGLLDFPSLYRGEVVLLCWKLGEDRIGFWHGMDEGFRGRKPIDEHFLKNHKGDFAQ